MPLKCDLPLCLMPHVPKCHVLHSIYLSILLLHYSATKDATQ